MLTCVVVASSIILLGPKDIVVLPKDELVHIELEAGQIVVNGIAMNGVNSEAVKAAINNCDKGS